MIERAGQTVYYSLRGKSTNWVECNSFDYVAEIWKHYKSWGWGIITNSWHRDQKICNVRSSGQMPVGPIDRWARFYHRTPPSTSPFTVAVYVSAYDVRNQSITSFVSICQHGQDILNMVCSTSLILYLFRVLSFTCDFPSYVVADLCRQVLVRKKPAQTLSTITSTTNCCGSGEVTRKSEFADDSDLFSLVQLITLEKFHMALCLLMKQPIIYHKSIQLNLMLMSVPFPGCRH